MQDISLLDMLKSGLHFGHKTSKWHPKMAPFIFGQKNDVHIINLEATKEKLEAACKLLKDLAAQRKVILFVGTKRQAKELVQKYAKECGMPYVTERWLGGLLTNFENVSRLPKKLTTLKDQREKGVLAKYTKKEQLEFDREIAKLSRFVGGIEDLTTMPEMLFVIDIAEEKTAIREARVTKTKVMALVDSNTNPDMVTYPIPGNDDATKGIELILQCVSQAISEGKKLAPALVAPVPFMKAPMSSMAPGGTAAPVVTPAPATPAAEPVK